MGRLSLTACTKVCLFTLILYGFLGRRDIVGDPGLSSSDSLLLDLRIVPESSLPLPVLSAWKLAIVGAWALSYALAVIMSRRQRLNCRPLAGFVLFLATGLLIFLLSWPDTALAFPEAIRASRLSDRWIWLSGHLPGGEWALVSVVATLQVAVAAAVLEVFASRRAGES